MVQHKRTRKRWSKDDTELTLLAAPTTIWYILFSFLPMFGVIIAFKDFRVRGSFISSVFSSPWAGGTGLKNFQAMFSFSDIWMTIRNTIGYNLVFILLNMVVPVALALMMGQLYSKRLGKVYQSAIFFPYFLSWVVVSALVMGFLSYDKGYVNSVIASMGGERVQWYMQPQYWPLFLTFMNIWKGLGYNMVIYLATITNLDSTYYEAALIDGASKWQQMRYITLPLIRTTIIIMLIMAVGRIFSTDFGLFYQVPQNSSSLYNVTTTIDVYVFTMMKKGSTGMASAAALVQSVVGCIMVLAANGVVRKINPDSAMI